MLAGLSFAGEADALAVVDAGGDIHFHRFAGFHAAFATAFDAGLFDFLAAAVAGGQVCCIWKMAWRTWMVPEPWQVEQVLAEVPGLAPEPWQTSHSS